MTALHTTQATK